MIPPQAIALDRGCRPGFKGAILALPGFNKWSAFPPSGARDADIST